jgi:cell division protein ZapA (FtsZ GTPase activity inhibitor)
MGNIIITEKQLERLTKKIKQSVNENQEQGSYMAKQQLYTIATLAHTMWEKMEEGEQLEDWMETKIAQAEQSITSVVNNFMYKEVDSTVDGTKDVNFDEFIIGK